MISVILLLILPDAPQSLMQSTTQSTDLPCSKDELLDPLDSKPGDFIIVGIFNVGQVNTHTHGHEIYPVVYIKFRLCEIFICVKYHRNSTSLQWAFKRYSLLLYSGIRKHNWRKKILFVWGSEDVGNTEDVSPAWHCGKGAGALQVRHARSTFDPFLDFFAVHISKSNIQVKG